MFLYLTDACQSNPCQNQGECSPDDKTGFRCTNCAVGYYGLMCELGEYFTLYIN